MKSKCQNIKLDLFLDDELSRSKKAQVEAHLAGCNACRNRLEAFQMQAEIIKEELEVMGPVRLSDVETAQMEIVKVARRLEEEGKIVLAGKGGGESLV